MGTHLQDGPHHPVDLQGGPQLVRDLLHRLGGVGGLHEGGREEEQRVDDGRPRQLRSWREGCQDDDNVNLSELPLGDRTRSNL